MPSLCLAQTASDQIITAQETQASDWGLERSPDEDLLQEQS